MEKIDYCYRELAAAVLKSLVESYKDTNEKGKKRIIKSIDKGTVDCFIGYFSFSREDFKRKLQEIERKEQNNV